MGKEKEILKPYRERIDALDKKIVDLLVERSGIIREVADVKYEHDIPATLQYRVDEVRENAANDAEAKGLDPDLVRQIYAILIAYSCDLEDGIMEIYRDNEKQAQGAE